MTTPARRYFFLCVRRLLFFILCLLLALGGVLWGWREHRRAQVAGPDRLRMTQLLEENARLRALVETTELQRRTEEENTIRTKIEKDVAEIRGLDFLATVAYDELPRETLREVIAAKIDDRYSPEELVRLERGYAAMGLLPEGMGLRETFLDLLGEQVAAFYDQHADTLHTFENSPLRRGQNRIILAHELTHALQDQHFSLENFPLESTDNDDLATATSALIEGDATLLMAQYMVRAGGNMGVGDVVGMVLAQGTEKLRAAPFYLRESLLFPYLAGQTFCTALFAHGGWGSLNAAYETPPTSTRQILHPDEYLADPDRPAVLLDWRGVERAGTAEVVRNILGEFGLRTLLTPALGADIANAAAHGIRADGYLVLESAPKPEVMAWTVWDTPGEAAEFRDAIARHLASRHGGTWDAGAEEVRFRDRVVNIWNPLPDQVAWIEAATPERAAALRQTVSAYCRQPDRKPAPAIAKEPEMAGIF